MKTFLTHSTVKVTPLTPIHIGCGEVYEPTGYVIDCAGRCLYSFEADDAVLTAGERAALTRAVAKGEPAAVNRFFSESVNTFRPWARAVVPVSTNCAAAYAKMLSPKGNQKATAFEIQRTVTTGPRESPQAYLPGSSLKGAIVTALEERLNQRIRLRDREDPKLLLGGDFEKSPMRFLKVGDCTGEEVLTRAFFCRRFFRDNYSGDGVESTFEAIEPGQYRALTGEITLAAAQNIQRLSHVYERPEEVFRDLHAYALVRWEREVPLLAHFDLSRTKTVIALLRAMTSDFREGRAALIRVGKNCGAESKTIRGLNKPSIEIRRKAKDPRTGRAKKEWLDHTTTVWLTDEVEPQLNGLPFGWAIAELEPDETCAPLLDWCERTRAEMKEASCVFVPEVKRALAEERDAKLAARDAPAAAAGETPEEASADQTASDENLSPEERPVKAVVGKLEAVAEVKPGTPLYAEVKSLLETALGWSDAEMKRDFALLIGPLMKSRKMFVGKYDKLFKQQIRELKGE